ncbi:hypothetical protein EDB80DRAFT_746913 [Ilyonectria destructans]|nr:hypothetical protein EDB80DRAFT_746913 [Ilyonectria destructans]
MATKPAERLQLDLSEYKKLDSLQAGHIRHFHNLASQLDGEWHHMGSKEAQQEFLDAFRYQISAMAYSASVAHYHRLPAARSIFKPLIRRLIHKMLLPEVWAYCGHFLLMTSLYAMLFDDDEFEQPNSLTFEWSPLLWGLGPETFHYDTPSLQAAILAEMERNKWVGVCCEPNNVFAVCNQFPLIAIRYNDVRDGTNKIEDVLIKYRKAWDEKGMVSPSGLYMDWLFLKQDRAAPPTDIGFSACQSVAEEYRRIGVTENTRTHDTSTLARACAEAAKQPASLFPFHKPSFGYVGLLQHAENCLRPIWEKGGLFYPRNDVQSDKEAVAHMDPYTGNAAIAYARLNVKDGQKIMWETPWTRKHLEKQPWINGIDLSQGIDCLRSIWGGEKEVLAVTLKTWNSSSVAINITAKNIASGVWAVYIDGELAKTNLVEHRGLTVAVTVASKEVDVVFKKLN